MDILFKNCRIKHEFKESLEYSLKNNPSYQIQDDRVIYIKEYSEYKDYHIVIISKRYEFIENLGNIPRDVFNTVYIWANRIPTLTEILDYLNNNKIKYVDDTRIPLREEEK